MKRTKSIENDTRSSSKELDTLEARFEEFSSLVGEWLLLKGDQLLAHSREYRDITAEIKKRHLKDCLVHYVPTPTERDFILI
jgi:hypothetical protein